jgi:hypothetical protein
MAKLRRRDSVASSATAADDGQKPASETAINFSQNDIARRAYDLYLARRREPGHHLEDWLQAEQELRERPLAGIV